MPASSLEVLAAGLQQAASGTAEVPVAQHQVNLFGRG
jgi:hypothetical protein